MNGSLGIDIVKYEIMAAEYAGTMINAVNLIAIIAINVDELFFKTDPTAKENN